MTRPDHLAPAAWVKKAEQETNEAIEAFRAARSRKTKFAFKFEAYGDVLLRDALNKVYGFKCAYCESFFGATAPVAVEHYRPKGKVIEEKGKSLPGYYWLAATWGNLLPSCTDWNSRRGQGIPGEKKVTRGKGNYFPLADDRQRAKGPGQETREEPLLLHPEHDDPAEHLEFPTDRKRAGVIRATLRSGTPSKKGTASIDVYALDRPQLTQERRLHAIRLLSHIRNTKLTERYLRESPKDRQRKRDYEENLQDLAGFLEPGNPYCAMLRQIAHAELPGLEL